MTSIRAYDPASAGTALPDLPPLPIGALVVGAAELLQQAASLPAPAYVTVHGDTQSISLQFAPRHPSVQAIIQWAGRFGAVMTSCPYDEDQPDTWTWYRTGFNYYGIAVTAYAVIQTGQPGS